MKYKFPKDFLWGASTSSHQIEGGLTNNWTQWELKTALRNSKEGIRPTVQELEILASEKENYLSNSKYSCDSFNHYKEDIKVLKELGVNAYRFSIEWSRIEPEKGVFDKEGLEYYKKLVRELKQNGIEPVVTLWHWTIPLWLEKEGGVLSRNFSKYFDRMSTQVLESISEDVKYWITINEPEVFSNQSFLKGNWPPNERNIFKFLKFYLYIFPKVHKRTYKLIKRYNPKAMVSFAKNNSYIRPYNKRIWNILMAKILRSILNYIQIDLVKGYIDYIGLNYYFQNNVGIKGLKNDKDKVSDLGWWLKPESIEYVIKELYERYRLPILITENGLADSKDKNREWWIEKSTKAIHKARAAGCDVFGYLHWSLLDNFEWDKGFWPRFGLVSINPNTKERVIKKSGYFYKKLIKVVTE